MECKRAEKRPREKFEVNDVKVYKFKVLIMKSGVSVNVSLTDPKEEMLLKEFLGFVKMEYLKLNEGEGDRSGIVWDSKGIWLEDVSGKRKFKNVLSLQYFQPHKCCILQLYDGSKELVETFENMWDLTPDPELLIEYPQEYTPDTAIADLIDNSLQAVWSNNSNEIRRISVTFDGMTGISISDSGPGMDGHEETSIVKWGKIGASLHRSKKGQAIGGKPPYLTPFFGMFGFGGAIASMFLGRHVVVSSKTKESEKVFTLNLKEEALIRSVGENIWKTTGGIRDRLADEIELSPHGSFTKVQILRPKIDELNIYKLKSKLKDIYFPYIQCDDFDAAGGTCTPVEFQVNGMNLAEFLEGEVATTNLHSCNGPDFVFQIRLSTKHSTVTGTPGSKALHEAHARLKCVYFPHVKGKESIDMILENLKDDDLEVSENFDTFCRVSIRRLGRLLPDARWGRLPFMDPIHKRGEKAQIIKKYCSRVKCFVDTDAGFNPTISKTNLAHHHPCTIALKNFGDKSYLGDGELDVHIYRGKKKVDISNLRKEYMDWVSEMHLKYDQEEDVVGESQPFVIPLTEENKKILSLPSEVVRIRKDIQKKGVSWKSGERIKILKGAAPGCHKNNMYATLECILEGGLDGDYGAAEARLICRPLDVPEKDGFFYDVNYEKPIDIRHSKSFPISIIDSGKCIKMTSSEWNLQHEKRQQKTPCTIDLLTTEQCLQLELDGTLPVDAAVYAGQVDLKQIVAVVRPECFNSSNISRGLDQKYIIKDDLGMLLEIKYVAEEKQGKEYQKGVQLWSGRGKLSSLKSLNGLYIFEPRRNVKLQKAGVYTFSFSVACKDSSIEKYEKRVMVKPCTKVACWKLSKDEIRSSYKIRVGCSFPDIYVGSYDEYGNKIPFICAPDVTVKVIIGGSKALRVEKKKVSLSSDNKTLEVSDILIELSDFREMQPSNAVTLEIISKDKQFSVSAPCKVVPGPVGKIRTIPPYIETPLVPGLVIEDLVLEVFDVCDNRVKKGSKICLDINGFSFQDHRGPMFETDDDGCINLSGILKVVGGFGETVSISVSCEGQRFLEKSFQVKTRFLRTAFQVPELCPAGSQLKNILFEVVSAEGIIDESVDDMKFGLSHTLKLTWQSVGADDAQDILYIFRRGRCSVPSISIPRSQGIYSVLAAHSNYTKLCVSFKINVTLSDDFDEYSQFSQGLPDDMLAYTDSSIVALPSKNEALLNFVGGFQDNLKKAEYRVKLLQERLNTYNDRKNAILKEIKELQGSVKPLSLMKLEYKKEAILERVDRRSDNAASVVSDLMKLQGTDMVGVVFQLGTVIDVRLSRVLSDYLGEDQMLAIVCKSYTAARHLEMYEQTRIVTGVDTLHTVARDYGKSITGRFDVICLDEISPYCGGRIGDGPQSELALRNPILPNGTTQPGFKGYAVNMISLDADHLSTRTSKDHDLRATLFYRLFGELQVYETRDYLRRASPYIKHGAVSLDGGILKGNGVISLRYCQPDICFPVICEELSAPEIDIVNQINSLQLQLQGICQKIQHETDALVKAMKEHETEKMKFDMIVETGPLFISKYLESC